MSDRPQKLWLQLRKVLAQRGVSMAESATPAEIAEQVSHGVEADAVRRFVHDYLYKRQFGVTEGVLTDEDAAALVARVASLPAVKGAAAAAGPKMDTRPTAPPSVKTPISTPPQREAFGYVDPEDAAAERERLQREAARKAQEKEQEEARRKQVEEVERRKAAEAAERRRADVVAAASQQAEAEARAAEARRLQQEVASAARQRANTAARRQADFKALAAPPQNSPPEIQSVDANAGVTAAHPPSAPVSVDSSDDVSPADSSPEEKSIGLTDRLIWIYTAGSANFIFWALILFLCEQDSRLHVFGFAFGGLYILYALAHPLLPVCYVDMACWSPASESLPWTLPLWGAPIAVLAMPATAIYLDVEFSSDIFTSENADILAASAVFIAANYLVLGLLRSLNIWDPGAVMNGAVGDLSERPTPVFDAAATLLALISGGVSVFLMIVMAIGVSAFLVFVAFIAYDVFLK